MPFALPSSFPLLEEGRVYQEGEDPTGKWRVLKSRVGEVAGLQHQPQELRVATWNLSGLVSNPSPAKVVRGVAASRFSHAALFPSKKSRHSVSA